jgi:acyl-CoA thioesterase I
MINRSLPSDRRTALVYVALGDSTVYGLGASSASTHCVARLFWRLHSEYPLARLANRGACLATMADVLAHQVPEAIMDRPYLITLSVGPNDLRQGRSPQEFAARTEVILERLQHDTDAAVILNALPDLALSPRFREPERSMVAALTRRYNHALAHVADDFGIELVDLGIRNQIDDPQRFFSEDGYHPSDAGYAAWAGAMWEAVRGRIPEQTRLVARPA